MGFRFFAQDAASREGLSGYVRNEPDRSVEVVVEGDAEAVDRFEMAVRRGPRGARVDEVWVDTIEPSGRFIGFSIR